MSALVRSARCAIAILLAAVVALSACSSDSGSGYTHPSGATPERTVEAGTPYGVAITSDGEVFVTELGNGTLGTYALPSVALNGSKIIVSSAPTDVTFLPSGAKAYVTNQLAPNIGIVDVATRMTVDSVITTNDPYRVRVAPNGATVYATTNTGELLAISVATKAVVTVQLTGAANGIAFNPKSSMMYVSTMSGWFYEINSTNNTVVDSGSIPGTAQGVAVTPDGTTIFIANETGNLEVWDAGTFTRTTTTGLGSLAFDVAVTPDGAQVYVARAGAVVVLDASTRALVNTIAVGGSPRRIAFDRSGATAVITNSQDFVTFVH